jgi:hypothetical protein
MRVIQIPVNYTERVGHSSVTGNKIVAFFLGLRMIRLILSYRLASWLRPNQYGVTRSLPERASSSAGKS